MRRSSILRIIGSSLGVVLFCGGVCTIVAAQEFSADLVSVEGNQTKTNSKVYVEKNRVRIEGQGEEGRSGIMVIDNATGVVDVIVPQQHMYMESKAGQGPGRNVFQLFQIMDVENACPEWQKIKKEHGETSTCQKIGDDTWHGRSAVKYVGSSSGGRTSTVWIDKSLKFPIHWEDENDKGGLENIQEGPQAASLFAIPAGYQKMDLGNMMMRGQHH